MRETESNFRLTWSFLNVAVMQLTRRAKLRGKIWTYDLRVMEPDLEPPEPAPIPHGL
ncbi:MAG: hypothetical protein ACLRZG_03615 [Streptococcus sp.]